MRNPKDINSYMLTKVLNSDPNVITNLVQVLFPLLKLNNPLAMKCFYMLVEQCNDNNLIAIFNNLIVILGDIFQVILSLKIENHNAEYNFQFFEMVALLFSRTFTVNIEAYKLLKQGINKYIETCLTNNVTDLFNYVFQILAVQLGLDKQYEQLQNVSVDINNLLYTITQ